MQLDITTYNNQKQLPKIFQRVGIPDIPPVDKWYPPLEDQIFKESKGVIIAPIHLSYNMPENNHIDYFHMTPKKCYNSDTKVDKNGVLKIGFREHLVIYLNYFEKFYDRNHYLLGIYSKIKWCIDCLGDKYTTDAFIGDLNKYIISYHSSPLLYFLIKEMNDHNYIPMTTSKKDTRNPCLEYHDHHAKLLFIVALYQMFTIPLISHFMHIKGITSSEDTKEVLTKVFNSIFNNIYVLTGVDLLSKLYETVMANIGKSMNHDKQLWEMQEIRGINPNTHAMTILENLVCQIIPKYVYNQSIICFNFNSIAYDIKFKVTKIQYEYMLRPVSSSIRDEDNNSQTDKFEAYMIKKNEAEAAQYKVNSDDAMKIIDERFGPFNEHEIEFYIKELTKDGSSVKSGGLQYTIISFIFVGIFGDMASIRYVNEVQYVKLIIAAKKLMNNYGIFTLAEIVGGKTKHGIARKSISKTMITRLKMSEKYPRILGIYKNEDIIESSLFSLIAQSIASDFTYISYYDQNINGQPIVVDKDIICEEFMNFTIMINSNFSKI
jgi:hypothetical protein